MRLAQEHLLHQSIKDTDSILLDWENGAITAQDAYNDIIKLKDAGYGYKTLERYGWDNPHPLYGPAYRNPSMRRLVDYLTGQPLVMADPLPHPSEDTPQKPNPNQEPSSPYLPGQSPYVPSRDDKLAGVRPGMMGIPGSEEEDTKFPMPIIEEDFPGDPGIGPDSIPTPTEQYYDPVQTIAELNPAQIEALKGIPPNIRDLPKDERLDIMRKITEQVKAKGLV